MLFVFIKVYFITRRFWQTEFGEDFQKSKKDMNRKLIVLQRLMENGGDAALLEYMQIDTL